MSQETQTKQAPQATEDRLLRVAPEWVTAITDKLEQGIAELFGSEKYKNYLNKMSQFHQYSPRNIMLILQQKPDATRVASFKKWSEEFNRHPKKGEKSIRIFAPIEIKVQAEKLDPKTLTPLRDKDGNIVTEEIKQQRFKLVPVFDISQTDGDPLPQITEDLVGNAPNYGALLESLKAISPVPIVFEMFPPGHDGYYNKNKIGIREGMSEPQTIATLAHEIAHAKMHGEGAAHINRNIKELEAESVAYVVCQKFGIETAPNSFGYLASWSNDNLEEFYQSLGRIRSAASGIIIEVEAKFSELYKATEIEQAEAKPGKKPSLKETLAINAQKSREQFGSASENLTKSKETEITI